METQTTTNDLMVRPFIPGASTGKGMKYTMQSFPEESFDGTVEKTNGFESFFKQDLYSHLDILLKRLAAPVSKTSFLVFKNNKYIIVPTESIAFFYVKNESTIIVGFDKQEYFVNYSLDQVQQLLDAKEFFRLNRQYLISFIAVKEVEHYFARKLLVNLTVPFKEKLLVSREKVSSFLHWLDNR